MKGGFNDVIRAGHIDRPGRVREAECLFRAQRPFIRLRVKLNISAGALITEPLANVTLVRIRSLREFRGCNGTLGELLIEA